MKSFFHRLWHERRAVLREEINSLRKLFHLELDARLALEGKLADCRKRLSERVLENLKLRAQLKNKGFVFLEEGKSAKYENFRRKK